MAYFRRNIGTIDPLLKDAEFLGLTDNQLIDLVLDDGSYAHGVTWESKHGHGRCWAYWMRRVDDGGEVSDEALKQLDEGKVLSENDASIKAVAEQMGITIC